MSSAERMRRLREKAAQALHGAEGEPGKVALSELSDTGLLEAIREPVKHGQPSTLLELMGELMTRANARRSGGPVVHLGARFDESDLWVEYTRHETGKDDGESAGNTVTETGKTEAEPVETGRTWEYPPGIKAEAVRWKRKGMKHAEICSRIQAECGRAPGIANMPKLLKNWAVDPAVLAILNQTEESS